MLITNRQFTVNPNTPESNPVTERVALSNGRLTRLIVWFKSGCAGLVGFRLVYGDELIIPYRVGEWLRFDDYVLTLDVNISLDRPPYEIDMQGISPGTIFYHTLDITFVVDSGSTINIGRIVSLLGS